MAYGSARQDVSREAIRPTIPVRQSLSVVLVLASCGDLGPQWTPSFKSIHRLGHSLAASGTQRLRVMYLDIGCSSRCALIQQQLRVGEVVCTTQQHAHRRDQWDTLLNNDTAPTLPTDTAIPYQRDSVDDFFRLSAFTRHNPMMRPEVLQALWRATVVERFPYVWILETDVACLGDWGATIDLLDQSLRSTDWLSSKDDMILPEHRGNTAIFIRHDLWRRSYVWVARLSASLVRAVHDYVGRGLLAYYEQLIPTVCSAVGCNAKTLDDMGFEGEWSWLANCRAIVEAMDELAHPKQRPPWDGKQDYNGTCRKFVHPFKWDTLYNATAFAAYAQHPAGETGNKFGALRARAWGHGVPPRTTEREVTKATWMEWATVSLPVQQRCRYPEYLDGPMRMIDTGHECASATPLGRLGGLSVADCLANCTARNYSYAVLAPECTCARANECAELRRMPGSLIFSLGRPGP